MMTESHSRLPLSFQCRSLCAYAIDKIDTKLTRIIYQQLSPATFISEVFSPLENGLTLFNRMKQDKAQIPIFVLMLTRHWPSDVPRNLMHDNRDNGNHNRSDLDFK